MWILDYLGGGLWSTSAIWFVFHLFQLKVVVGVLCLKTREGFLLTQQQILTLKFTNR